MKKIISLLFICTMLCCALPVMNAEAAEPTGNSYFYNNDEKAIVCPQPYIVEQMVNRELEFTTPVAMTVYEDKVYVLNSDGRIVVLNLNYEQEQVISFLKDGQAFSFVEVKGLWIADHEIFVTDRGGGVVVRSDMLGNVTKVYTEPLAEGEEASGTFLPTGVVTDEQGNIYIMVESEYRGLVVIDEAGEFKGYFGANTVEVTYQVVLDNLWRKYYLTEAQINASTRNLPSPFLAITANDGFVYATNSGNSNKLTKLNYNGNNVLTPDGVSSDVESEGHFASVTTDASGFITVLETNKNQIMQFDSEGNLLYIFGGVGNTAGSFVEPVAICFHNNKLLVLDAGTNSITVFVPSSFGASVREFRLLDIAGRYEEASVEAEKTLRICNEYESAYYSLAQYAYSNENYKLAMEYFKACNSQDGYSKAFEGNRMVIMKKLFPFVVVGILVLIVLSQVFSKRKKKEEQESILFTSRKDLGIRIKFAFYTVLHPVDGYAELRFNKLYSLGVANVLYAISFFVTTMQFVGTGYTFSTTEAADYNLFFCLAQTIGVMVLFVVSSRLIATFMGGVATLKELWITVGYAQIPMIVGNLLFTILSNMLTAGEGVFLGYMLWIAMAYTYIMMFFAVMETQMYSFKVSVVSTVFTIFGMLICVFLIFLTFNLLVEFLGFAETLVKEIVYRINYGF